MTIYIGSRYEDSVVDFISLSEDGDATPVVFYDFSPLGLLSYEEYTWKRGDRLDAVAFEFYRDADKWWIIPEYNPQIADPTSIAPGTVIRIPRV